MRTLYIEKSGDAASMGERIAEIVDHSSLPVVITNGAGRVIRTNAAFVSLCAVNGEAQLVGLPLEQADNDQQHSIAAIIKSVHQHGMKSGHRIQMASSDAISLVSAALLTDDGDQERIGFVFRQLLQSSHPVLTTRDQLLSAIASRIEQFGKLPLPELVRSITEIAEQQLLVHALQRSSGDRDSAAGLLGISTEYLTLYAMRHDLDLSQRDERQNRESDPVTRH